MTPEKLIPGHPDTMSANLVTKNIAQLGALFPEVIKEGKVDFDALHDLLGEYAATPEERFGLGWAGKAQARREAQKPSTGTLLPCPEQSVNWDTTQNLYIEGDNLEVLKLLQKSYNSKIKMIYIDPPYNTGKDFVYRDNYTDNLSHYLEITNQNKALSTNTESDGRYHSNWLNMMYPRLKLARNLLTEDGVIFISIGEEEIDNMIKIGNEVFGEENKLGIVVRVAKTASNKGTFFAPSVDYIVVYGKCSNDISPFIGEVNEALYKKIETEGDRKGEKYRDDIALYQSALDPMRGCSNQRYYIEAPDGSLLLPPGEVFPADAIDGSHIAPKSVKDKVWRWTFSTYMKNKDLLVFKQTNTSPLIDEHGNKARYNIYTKSYFFDRVEAGTLPRNFWENFFNRKGADLLKKIGIPFDFSKPVELIENILKISNTKGNDIILDFFSGSATTAHAVMQLNAEDGGNRKFIMVQLPEPTPENSEAQKAGYKNICEIGKERIRRAGRKILEEQKTKTPEIFATEKPKLDVGFKIFKLDSSNIVGWDGSPEAVEGNLLNSIRNIKDNRTEHDLLYEILLKYGIDLAQPINEHTLDGKKVYEMGAGALFVCMADGVTTATAEAIVRFWNELKPETANEKYAKHITCRVVFKDSGFAKNNDKTNVLQTFRQRGISNVVTI